MSIRKKCVWIFFLCIGPVLYQWSIIYQVSSDFYGGKREDTSEKIRQVFSDPPKIIVTSDDELGLVKGKEEMKVKEDGYLKYAFNILVSNRIGFNRSIPDTKDEKCLAKVPYLPHKLKASIVICFYNEAWSTLLRTIYSIIERSPKDMLQEIILIDDKSTHHHLLINLPIYLDKYLPVVKLFRVQKREGLIRARLKGAQHARGDVLVFLDSHCEVNTYWLEPLLSRISNDQKTVVCPVIDTINSHTFVYEASELVRGGFNWGMHFSWESVPASQLSDMSQPFMSPTMAGGLFAIDRNYFFKLGSYDKLMDIWGGENLEISFRIWMCGGRLEIIPCSRVGHVFRDRRPYGNNGEGDTMSKNTVRLVEVWLDDYKEHFYSLRPELRSLNVDVSMRKALRRGLGCKSFKWYLDTVYPELGIPTVRDGAPMRLKPAIDSPSRVKGKLQNIGLFNCFNVILDKAPKKVILSSCQEATPLKHTFNDEIKVGKRLCLDAVLHTYTKKQARITKCHGSKEGQEWRYKTTTQQLYNPALGMCLAGIRKQQVVAQICDALLATQKWRFMD